MKKEDKGITNWRVPQITIIEFVIGMLGLALVGLGLGAVLAVETGKAMDFLIWVGWGISLIAPILLWVRLSADKEE